MDSGLAAPARLGRGLNTPAPRATLLWAGLVGLAWVCYRLLRRRGERLLALDRAAAADAIDSATPLPAGLPPGSPAPAFALPDLEGRERTLGELLGRPLLIVFFSPRCGYCTELAPRPGREAAANAPRILLVSRGDPAEHRRLAERYGWQCDVLLDADWAVTRAYRTTATPSAYLLDADGYTVGQLAEGIDALLPLLGDPATGPEPPDLGGEPAASGLRVANRPPPAAPEHPPLVAASILTTNVRSTQQRWERERRRTHRVGPRASEWRDPFRPPRPGHVRRGKPKQQYQLPTDDRPTPTYLGGPEPGTFVVYDWAGREMIWRSSWEPIVVAPNGFCFADGRLYLNDEETGQVFEVDLTDQPGRLLRRISHPYLNDLHSIQRTSRGLPITSSGTDLIVELDLEGNLLYEWWAIEHGYTTTLTRRKRRSGRGAEHRHLEYHTRNQTTHVNEATFRDPDERYLLALLFHQGQLIQVDRARPPAEQHAEVLLDGLNRPHGLKRTPDGWLLCSTASSQVLLLDHELRIADCFAYPTTWIQDCTMLTSGRILLNDAGRATIVELAGPPWGVVSQTHYPPAWRVARLLEVPVAYAEAFRRAAATRPESAQATGAGPPRPQARL